MNPFGFTFCKCKSTSIVAQMRWLSLSSKRCKIVSGQGWRIDLWGLSSQKIVSVESRQRQIQRQRQNWAKQPVYYSRWGSKAVLREDARQAASRRLERESFHRCRHAPGSLDVSLNFNYLWSSFFFALTITSSTLASSSTSTIPSPIALLFKKPYVNLMSKCIYEICILLWTWVWSPPPSFEKC